MARRRGISTRGHVRQQDPGDQYLAVARVPPAGVDLPAALRWLAPGVPTRGATSRRTRTSAPVPQAGPAASRPRPPCTQLSAMAGSSRLLPVPLDKRTRAGPRYDAGEDTGLD